MRKWGLLIPWCLLLILGCQGFAPLQPSADEERAARALETASIRVWAEGKPAFSGVSPHLAARGWERNLRLLHLEPIRSENFVQGATPQGHAFCMAFWEEKGGSRGELTWLPEGKAGAGMLSLLELEKKHRGDKAGK